MYMYMYIYIHMHIYMYMHFVVDQKIGEFSSQVHQKLGPQMLLSAKSQGTIRYVPEPRKIATIVVRRGRGTWQRVPVAI